MNRDQMEQGIRLFLEAIGRGFPGDDQERTPERVARAWVDELISGYAVDPTTELTWTPAPPDCGPVLVRNIDFSSICVHHLLPFFGSAHVAYLPGQKLAGLSKIGRVVDAHSRQLQTQEHLTSRIVATLDSVLEPRGVVVLLQAEHTCMTRRGVRKERSRMVTLAAAGCYEQDVGARRELLGLLQQPGE